MPYDHPQFVGAIGSTGTTAANGLVRQSDVVIGVGTRWSDFTAASRTTLGPGVRFINFNITRFDAAKNSGLPLVADVRRILADLTGVIAGWSVGPCCRDESGGWPSKGTPPVEQPTRRVTSPAGPSEVIGVVNALRGPRDVVVCASGSMPGDLHKQSRTRHVSYRQSLGVISGVTPFNSHVMVPMWFHPVAIACGNRSSTPDRQRKLLAPAKRPFLVCRPIRVGLLLRRTSLS